MEPLGIERGSSVIARRIPGVRVVPVAIRYELGEGQRVSFSRTTGPRGLSATRVRPLD